MPRECVMTRAGVSDRDGPFLTTVTPRSRVSLRLCRTSRNPPEPAHVPRNLFESFRQIKRICGVIVGETIQVHISRSKVPHVVHHAAQHLPAVTATLELPV